MRVACLSLPLLVTAVACVRYAKVDTSFPDSIATCLQGSRSFNGYSPSPVHMRCGAVCNLTPYCSLFCVKGVKCDTFNAKVTAAWVGPGSGTYSYDACFSVHPLVGDAALGSPTASASVYQSFQHEYPVSSNFFCYNEAPCYESLWENQPWWRVDLGEPLPVVRVRVSKVGLIDFGVVEVRVGNDTNVNNNPALDPPPSSTPQGGMELIPNTPIVGRYFFVTEPQRSDIRLCDVWVMTKYNN